MAETINGLYKAEVIHRRGPWRSFEAVEYATLEWVDWFNIAGCWSPSATSRLPKLKINIMLPLATSIWQRDSQPNASGRPGAVQSRNDKCGTLRLQRGSAIFDHGDVAYNVERRKDDIAIITPHLLGFMIDSSGCHIVYDETSFSQYLTLGRADPPTMITLPGINDRFDYDSLRQ